ncbi:GNAT family N-acetyltransferase [Microbacterium sp. GXS0129]|uniref:GNAT family N-acetyltransferase n=1 Tax=Microbacterium sp. GXS0129 TaxID=3377836 RepID=UPI00383B070A
MRKPSGPSFEYELITIPESVDAPDAAGFLDYCDIRMRQRVEEAGERAISRTPAEVLGWFLADAGRVASFTWVIREGAELIGRAGLAIELDTAERVSPVVIEISSAYRGRGAGTEMARIIRDAATREGAGTLRVWSEHEAGSGVDAASGHGSIPCDDTARFILAQGFTLQQVYVRSELNLPECVAAMSAIRAEAERHTDGYRVEQFTLPLPRERVADFALMRERMSTDAPYGNLAVGEQVWDEQRVAVWESIHHGDGWQTLITMAIDESSDRAVAINELGYREDSTEVSQGDTLVLAEHRGHRLGTLVKAAGVMGLHERAPHAVIITTENAAENVPMLAINDVLGFTPVKLSAAWDLTLN